ncbi:methyltransferase family protein [Evansella tamaricis]|uniref:methyltransferase family protein n=1 Tax=Evansella tamaricis TaxID=2069301 RepID=UPI00362FFC68
MNIAIIIFLILLSAWLFELVIFEETANKRKEVKQELLMKTLITCTFLLSLTGSFLLGKTSGEPMLYTKTIGIIFLIQGLFLRYWTYYLIKPHFTRTIMPLANRPLYSHGPFRFTRHPFHTGFFLITLGINLFISGNWLSILPTFIFVASALHYRMTLEEAYYSEKYGDIYAYWCRHRFRLLPFLY